MGALSVHDWVEIATAVGLVAPGICTIILGVLNRKTAIQTHELVAVVKDQTDGLTKALVQKEGEAKLAQGKEIGRETGIAEQKATQGVQRREGDTNGK